LSVKAAAGRAAWAGYSKGCSGQCSLIAVAEAAQVQAASVALAAEEVAAGQAAVAASEAAEPAVIGKNSLS
jgi:hypothetical protein